LAQGYPIASGVIEGACRHVVKDRMERTGMNSRVPRAKAMLELRCVISVEIGIRSSRPTLTLRQASFIPTASY